MTTDHHPVPGSAWAGAIPPPPFCACTGMSWGEISKDHSIFETLLGIYQSTRRNIPEVLDLQQMLTSEDLCILSSNYSYHSSTYQRTTGSKLNTGTHRASTGKKPHFLRRRMLLSYTGSMNYKFKVHHRTGYEGHEREKYSSTLSLTSELGVGLVVKATPRRLYSRERDPVPNVKRLGRPQGLAEHVRKISPPPGFDPWTVQPVKRCYHGPKYITYSS